MTFVGWMVFETEGLEGIRGSEQIRYLSGNIWVYANGGEKQTRNYAALIGQTKNKALFMH